MPALIRRAGAPWLGRLALLLLSPAAARAQVPAEDSLAVAPALGLPTPIRLYTGLGLGVEMAGEQSAVLSRLMIGGSHDITNPVPGLAGVGVEGYIGGRTRSLDGGGRLLFTMNAAGVQVGADYSLRLGRADAVLTFTQPVRRGGILFPGAGLRFDWIPARSELAAAISVPLAQRHAGRTRPREAYVSAVEAPPPRTAPRLDADPALHRAVEVLRHSALAAAQVVAPYLPAGAPLLSGAQAARLRSVLLAGRGGAVGTIAGYHRSLREAFEVALDDSATALLVTEAARALLLEEVLLPYDRDLGQIRRRAVLRALRGRAAAGFADWVAECTAIPADARPRVVAVYDHLLAAVQEMADTAQARWADSRYVWLPLQLGLTPDQHDTQPEIDRLVERVIGRSFEDGHDLIYATDERFQSALQRSILEAQDYHVLWVHDFAGRNGDGGPDTVAQQIVQTYLTALTVAAGSFESVGRVPTFFIFLDQYYYGRSRSVRWLELLHDPLGHEFRLPRRYGHIERSIRNAQEQLRGAVEGSPALQAEARRRGQRWLRDLVSVRVSVTHPPDPSFRGPREPGILVSGMTDDIMRDHRKVAFADITERDPTRGVAMLTGLGVGEHYARYQWLDRTLVVRGPAAVTLKHEARALLLSQGFREDEIPGVLRPRPGPADPAGVRAALSAREWNARVAIAINRPGYGPKQATAAKAALYTLLPAGCTIVAADPQWLSRFWGGMLLGSALRGCQVLVIGPGPDNAPFSTAFVQRILQRDLFGRLMSARDTLRRELEASGGGIAIGLFRIGYGTHNVPAGVREVRDGLRRHPFLKKVLPFHQGVWELFEQADSLLFVLGESALGDDAVSYHPRFHLKTQFFGSADGVRGALGRPEWRQFFVRRIRERLHESPAGTDITLDHLSMLREYLDGRPPEVRDRQVLYLEVGSHNQDPRSFMLDGEELCLVAGESALIAAGDMLLLSTVGVDWLDDHAALDRNWPPMGDGVTDAARAAEAIF